jgi:hypothetical protein
MTNNGLNGISTLQSLLKSPGIQAAFLPDFVEGGIGNLNAAIAQVDKHLFRAGSTADFSLFQAGF